ncbi:6585_t:CDS:2 [Funneliformis caledonium]|uniref:6585_t:CDS:1 n=1 Tax=Funneliformis caledonium TaxID=1117310 RepID=A0A9N8V666_9GLOM|nr:6585_t:CDS:2 [Funneliformis caledonium]
MSSNILLNKLVKNYETLLQNSVKNYDMIIKCGEKSINKTLYAHSLILSSQSTYFQAALSSNWIKKEDGKILFEKENVAPKIFSIILKHLYCGEVTLDELNLLELLELISAADEFILSELMKFTETLLISLADTWMKTNFIKIHLHAHTITGCIALQDSSNFDNDSNLNETDVSEWNENNFKDLWEVLKNVIDFVRFCNISVEEFEKEVQPYSEMFPRKVYENIIWSFVKPQESKMIIRGNRVRKQGSNLSTKKSAFPVHIGGFPPSSIGFNGFGASSTTQPPVYGMLTTQPAVYEMLTTQQPGFAGLGRRN